MFLLINMRFTLYVVVFYLLLSFLQLFLYGSVTAAAEKEAQGEGKEKEGIAVKEIGDTSRETGEESVKISQICLNFGNLEVWQEYVSTNITALERFSGNINDSEEFEEDLNIIEIKSYIEAAREKASKIKEQMTALKSTKEKYCKTDDKFSEKEIENLAEMASNDAEKCEEFVNKYAEQQLNFLKNISECVQKVKDELENKRGDDTKQQQLKSKIAILLSDANKGKTAAETVQKYAEELIENLQKLVKIKETKKRETEENHQPNNGKQNEEDDKEDKINEKNNKIDQNLQESVEPTLKEEKSNFEDTLKMPTTTENLKDEEISLETFKNSVLCISVNNFYLLLVVCIVMLNQCVLFFF